MSAVDPIFDSMDWDEIFERTRRARMSVLDEYGTVEKYLLSIHMARHYSQLLISYNRAIHGSTDPDAFKKRLEKECNITFPPPDKMHSPGYEIVPNMVVMIEDDRDYMVLILRTFDKPLGEYCCEVINDRGVIRDQFPVSHISIPAANYAADLFMRSALRQYELSPTTFRSKFI